MKHRKCLSVDDLPVGTLCGSLLLALVFGAMALRNVDALTLYRLGGTPGVDEPTAGDFGVPASSFEFRQERWASYDNDDFGSVTLLDPDQAFIEPATLDPEENLTPLLKERGGSVRWHDGYNLKTEAVLDLMYDGDEDGLSGIEGVTPLPIPDCVTKYSAWMTSFSIDPNAFSCSGQEFADQVLQAGLTGAGQGKYYLMPAAMTFLQEYVDAGKYPYSQPPASRAYHYSSDTCPTAWAFLENWVRSCSISEKWELEHADTVVDIVAQVADANRT